MRALFLSHDGLLEPLGRSQIIPYLQGLAQRGAAISVLSFEKRADRTPPGRGQALRAELQAQGIRWIPLAYHRRPPVLATAVDVLVGTARAWGVIRQDGVQVVHARSYVAALMAVILKRLCGVRFLFDMRGFWADERAEAGAWSTTGLLYRLAKHCERVLLEAADEVVTLTEQARQTIESWLGERRPPITVVPTCVDLERFVWSPARARAPRGIPVFIYAGSVAPWHLPSEALRFVQRASRRFPNARLLILTRDEEEARRCLRESTLPAERVTVASVDPAEVPRWLAQADAGLAFYKPGFSRRGTCPTKIGEYLAMGLPVIVNRDVGDMAEVIGASGVGVVLSAFTPEAYDLACGQLERCWADPTLAARCRRVAESRFSLALGVQRYWAVYQRLGASPVCAAAVEAEVGCSGLAFERPHR